MKRKSYHLKQQIRSRIQRRLARINEIRHHKQRLAHRRKIQFLQINED